jgi:hypothetical protein
MNFINNSVTVINYNIYNDIYNILEIKLKMPMDICVSLLFTMITVIVIKKKAN